MTKGFVSVIQQHQVLTNDNLGLSISTLTCTTTFTCPSLAGQPNNYHDQDCVSMAADYMESVWEEKDCETNTQPLFVCKYTLSGQSREDRGRGGRFFFLFSPCAKRFAIVAGL